MEAKRRTQMTNSESAMPGTNPNPQVVYSPKELEPILKLSKNTINNLLRSGRLHSVRVGRRYLIPHTSLLRFLNAE